MSITRFSRLFFLIMFLATPATYGAQPLVPGTGQLVVQVGDDFEDPEWSYDFNLPKSTKNLNKNTGGQGGKSRNDRWYEGVKRGQPDIIKRVPTPAGLPGSEGSLLLRSLQTGVPGRPSYKLQQDDFICNIHYKLGGAIPINQSPSFVCKVFLPPVDQWEERNGASFAIRASVDTHAYKSKDEDGNSYGRTRWMRETYWPGMMIEFESKERSRRDYDVAWIRIRSNQNGADFKGPQITTTGWWTFGMSFTPDGQVHYYASPGVDDLTAEDHLTSQFPYGYRCERFETFFFDVCNGDDNRTWSTPWIVDDCHLYYIPQTARK